MITIDHLPPLISVPPEDLKLFSKTQLRVYLEAHGIEPLGTKPKMKAQLRVVIARLKKAQESGVPMPMPVALPKPVPSVPVIIPAREVPVPVEPAAAPVQGATLQPSGEDAHLNESLLRKRKKYEECSALPSELEHAKASAEEGSGDVLSLINQLFDTDADMSFVESEQPRKRLKVLEDIRDELDQLLSGTIADTTPSGLEIVHSTPLDTKLYTAL